MQKHLNIIQDKDLYYNLANNYLKKIDSIELDINFDKIIPKSISILVDHDYIPTPCLEIKLELFKDQKKTGNYFLYVDEKKEFIDEFLIT